MQQLQDVSCGSISNVSTHFISSGVQMKWTGSHSEKITMNSFEILDIAAV